MERFSMSGTSTTDIHPSADVQRTGRNTDADIQRRILDLRVDLATVECNFYQFALNNKLVNDVVQSLPLSPQSSSRDEIFRRLLANIAPHEYQSVWQDVPVEKLLPSRKIASVRIKREHTENVARGDMPRTRRSKHIEPKLPYTKLRRAASPDFNDNPPNQGGSSGRSLPAYWTPLPSPTNNTRVLRASRLSASSSSSKPFTCPAHPEARDSQWLYD